MKHQYLRSLTSSAALCLTLAGSAQLAHAQGAPAPDDAQPAPEEMPAEAAIRVLIVPISGETKAMSETAAQITSALADAATESGATVETSEASRSQITDLSDCQNEAPECMQEMLDAVSTDTLVLGNLTSTEGGWVLTVKQVRRGQEDKIDTHVLKGKDPTTLKTQVSGIATWTFGGTSAAPLDTTVDVVRNPNANSNPNLSPPVDGKQSNFSLSKVNTAAWVVTGAGAGISVAGAVFLVLASGKQSSVDSAPDATLEDINKLRDQEDTAESYELFGNSFLIAGAVTTLSGLTWVVKQANRSQPSESPSLVLSPAPTEGGAMLTLTLFQ